MKIGIHRINDHNDPPKYITHFRPYGSSGNVRCLNGSAHARSTNDINKVTCLKCLNPKTAEGFWHNHEQKHGNVMKNF